MRPLFVPAAALACALAASRSSAQQGERARDLHLPIGGTAGALDAITDVAGVEVGQVTLIAGEGKLVVGQGPVRTGVTAILPRGKDDPDPVFAAFATLNGNGEMTGIHWLKESGFLWGPVMMTNTMSVGTVRDATIAWALARHWDAFNFALPVVGETWDGGLNDIAGFHVTKADAFRALDGATGGPVAEGNVGGGTGMVCHQFKGGIGTASRVLTRAQGGYTVGVLVQCNYGRRSRLSIAGVPVGREITDLTPCYRGAPPAGDARGPVCGRAPAADGSGSGSIIVIVATDAPLLPHQLERIAKRVSLAIGRMGGLGEDSSGDLFLAFSTANHGAAVDTGTAKLTMFPNDRINPLFEATVQATEEAIVNAMLAARTMTGADGYTVFALPHDRLLQAMKKHVAPLTTP